MQGRRNASRASTATPSSTVRTSIRLSCGDWARISQQSATAGFKDWKLAMFYQVRLEMIKTGWISRLPNEYATCAAAKRILGGLGVALLLTLSGRALAQAD